MNACREHNFIQNISFLLVMLILSIFLMHCVNHFELPLCIKRALSLSLSHTQQAYHFSQGDLWRPQCTRCP